MHAEIERLADRIGAHVDLAEAAGNIQPDQVNDLLACLYGLYALLRLHFAQEEENYFTLVREDSGDVAKSPPAQMDSTRAVS